MNPERKRLYRDKLNGKMFGVCAGLADFFGINSLWPRLALFVLFFVTGPLVLIGYGIMAMILPKKPVHLYRESYWHVFADESPRPHPRQRSEKL